MQNLVVKLVPSKQHITLLGLVILSSILVIFTVSMPFSVKLALSSSVLCYGFYLLYEALLRLPHSIKGIRYLSDGSWLLETQEGEWRADLAGDSTVTPYVSILRFRLQQHPRVLNAVLLPDSLPTGQYRQIVVLARVTGSQ